MFENQKELLNSLFFDPIIPARRPEEVLEKLALESREGRVALLKAGFTGKDIELQYLRLNGIIISDVNWGDSPPSDPI